MKTETCKECKYRFESDSPYHDVYCGDCRMTYFNLYIQRREIPKNPNTLLDVLTVFSKK